VLKAQPNDEAGLADLHRAPGISNELRLGASYRPDGVCEFLVWAPNARRVDVRVPDENRSLALDPLPHGYFHSAFAGLRTGTRYVYILDGVKERADPASRYQPDGVFGPSQVFDLRDFEWSDREWHGLELQDFIFYELHVGAYTPAGTLDGLIEYISEWKDLGVTAIELMPLAQFSGTRNWGYDGVFPFAVQNSYGGPRALQRFVNACHRHGLAVVLDVVYNHLGPEGNFLGDFGPYFTDRYRTPWGQALNFDGAQSDEVIRFFIENALSWLNDFHIDALRLDAIHGIFDRSAQPFLSSLSSAVDALGARTNRNIYLIAESDLNDSRFLIARNCGGFGLHAQWNDDFHHSLHGLQTGERFGYYQDFGDLNHLEKALRNGYVYTGEYSQYRQRRHGNSARDIRPSQLVVYSQNHDQVGNRMMGERSSSLLSLEAQKLSAGVVVLSPYLPLLFMGEEYGETRPFLYFTSHADPVLGKAVQEGRRKEFSAFYNLGEPPDPQSELTFLHSTLDQNSRKQGAHCMLWEFYRELIRFRKNEPALRSLDKSVLDVNSSERIGCLCMRRVYGDDEILMIFNFGGHAADVGPAVPVGEWEKQLDSAEARWMGPGSDIPESFSADKVNPTIQPKTFCVLKRVASHPHSSLS
jgi:maltooligosyltrehalose trehalohydrolase